MSTRSRFSKSTKKVIVPNTVKAWSFSRHMEYDKCPFKFKCKAIDKLKEPTNQFAERGITTHARGEQYLRGKIRGVPDEFAQFKTEMQELKKAGAEPEYDLAVTRDWMPTVYNDWNGVWCRAKADALLADEAEGFSTDYKSGKEKADDEIQMNLYAVLMLAHFKKIKKALVEIWYLPTGKVVSDTYARKSEKAMRKDWEKRVEPMFTDTTFEPRENEGCRWCAFSKDKGGPCPIR